MKKIFIFLSICFLFPGCSRDEAPELPMMPVARFETDKICFDDGDTIQFINTSENADSFFWSFGNRSFSSDENPRFHIGLNDFQGYKFTALLTAYAADGRQDTCMRNLIISKRILRGIHILEMDSAIGQKAHGPVFNLITYMGPVNDPLEWIVPEQTFPSTKFKLDAGYPQELYLMFSWPEVAMNNEPWMIRFSSQPETGSTGNRILLKEFIINPCKADFTFNENGMRQFIVRDDEMTVAIDFDYIGF